MKTLNFTTSRLALIATTLAMATNLHAETTVYHGSGLNAYAYCYDYDDLTQTNTYFYSNWFADKQHVAGGAKDEYSYGYIYYSEYRYTSSGVEQCYGYLDVTDQSISKNLDSGTASGTMTLYCYSYDYETGEYRELETHDITVDVLLTGSGNITKSKYSYSEHDPSHFNSTYSSNGTFRQATPTILIDGEVLALSTNAYCYGYLSNSKWNSKTTVNP